MLVTPRTLKNENVNQSPLLPVAFVSIIIIRPTIADGSQTVVIVPTVDEEDTGRASASQKMPHEKARVNPEPKL